MPISRLRRVSAITWTVTALVILAVVPLGAVRAVARYLLIGYVPGLALWKYVRPAPTSLVELLLYPSLLSILPFSWLALACVGFGADLRTASSIAITVIVALGFIRNWRIPVTEAKDDRIALGLSAVLTFCLLVIPFAVNSFQAVAWDAPVHAAIVSRVLGGAVPPDSPIMAGQPANYYWLYHFYSAALMRMTGLSVYQVFAILNVHAFVLFVLAGYRIGVRLTDRVFGRIGGVWMLVFGLNAFGWIIFLASGSASPDKWYSLVTPFAMVKGYSPSLGSLIHEFLDGFPFAVSFAFDIAWLDLLLARIQGERGGNLITSGVILATLFYLHPLSAVFLITASFAAVLLYLLIDRSNIKSGIPLLVDLTIIALAAALVTVPYAWTILHGKSGNPLSVTLNSTYLKTQSYTLFATNGLIGVLAVPAIWSAFREKQGAAIVLALFAAAIALSALITHVALEAEYKLIYLFAFGLAPLVALAWNFWRRTIVRRIIFVIALAACLPTNALTSYCFTLKPPRETRDPTRLRLFDWIRGQTSANTILVEYPWWQKYQTSDAAFFYLDRFWFDIGVYAARRQLIGYSPAMLEQWGYRDIELRQALAGKLTSGETLTPEDLAYLVQLRAPIVVVTNSSVVGNAGFDSAIYTKIYEDGDLRAYRVVLPAL